MQTPSDTSYREIPLSQGKVALVDAADHEWLIQWKWHAKWHANGNRFYAARSLNPGMVRMHRFIMGLAADDARVVDHINRNGLDNRRSNLRICSAAQNRQNSPKRRDNTSGFKGVSMMKGKWISRINVDGKSLFLGYFANPQEAHEAYTRAANKHHREFANV